MKLKYLLLLIAFFVAANAHAQNIFPSTGSAGIGTTTPDASSLLEIKSTQKGILIPRMTKAKRDAIVLPATGLLIYQTNSTPGFYYYNGTVWRAITPKAGWLLTGNAGTNPATNFIGTTDAQPLTFKVNNQMAGLMDYDADKANTTFGYQSFFSNATGNLNVAIGYQALFSSNAGAKNTGTGAMALEHNTIGYANTASGFAALNSNTSGSNNVAIGYKALFAASQNYFNTAVGDSAMYNYNDGAFQDFHVALGYCAMSKTTIGYENTAIGGLALANNTTGYYNTAIGTLADVTSGALFNSAAFGHNAKTNESNKYVIGDATVQKIGGYANWTNFSDGRYKQNIKQNVPGLAFINKLNPVTYTLNVNAIDANLQQAAPSRQVMKRDAQRDNLLQQSVNEKSKIVYTGFVAQEVEKAAEELHYDFSGVDKPQREDGFYGLRYGDFVVPLVKAVQELSKKNDELGKMNDELKKQNDVQQNINIDLQNRLAKLEAMINVHQSTTNLSSASLDQNVPNPFSNSTTISYRLPRQFSSAKIIVIDESGITIKIFNLSGTGKGTLNFSSPVRVGASYQYSLLVDGKLIDTKQMVLAK